MAYVPVPKDLTKVKTKVMFNLTEAAAYLLYGRSAYWRTAVLVAP